MKFIISIHIDGCFIRFLFYLANLRMNMVSFNGVSKNIKSSYIQVSKKSRVQMLMSPDIDDFADY